MNQPPAFQPIGAAKEFLDGLRSANLAWIAEEIEASIREGTQAPAQGALFGHTHDPRRSGTENRPLSEEEQLQLAIRAVHHYLFEVHDMWRWIEEQWAQIPGLENTRFTIAYADTDEAIPLFDLQISPSLRDVDALLKSLWPGGADFYEKAMHELRGIAK